jgi:glycosyltransferase involved in cell wall biosynthesis
MGDVCPTGAACRLGFQRCHGFAWRRGCQLLAAGRPGIAAILRRETARLTADSPLPDPASRPPELPPPLRESAVRWRVALLNSWTGYGEIAIETGKALERLGVPVRYEADRADERFSPLDDWTLKRMPPDAARSIVVSTEGCPPGKCRYDPDHPEACPARRTGHMELCDWMHREPRGMKATMDRLAELLDAPVPATAPDRLRGQAVAEPPADDRLLLRFEHLNSWTGYGQIGLETGQALERIGVPVALDFRMKDKLYYDLPSWAKERLTPAPAGSWVLQLGTPGMAVDTTRRTVAFTMWESAGLHPAYVEQLEKAAAVIVPCHHNAVVISAAFAGAQKPCPPLYVVPMGCDPKVYFERPRRPEDGRTVFGGAGRMAHGGIRKGLVELARAFVRAFPEGTEPVELQLKVWPDCKLKDLPDDPRVKVVRNPMTPAQIAEWYAGLDCYATASKGEGWGLQTLQAMAVGRPVIAAKWSGTAEFFGGQCGYEVGFDYAPAGEFYAGAGSWIVPREADIAAAMRRVHAEPAEARARGAAAAARAAHFTWERTACELRQALVKIGMLEKPNVAKGTRRCCGG